ncbi:hypothetical protein ES319_D10G199700v1 [Gossypium barbadense]|uniref:Uncharacterized protein n=2 Tax=Gossypium TaxID=3633 RepID=A0A5J5PTL9_GOSBA|nr:hypothetical protein ES319_D10G199700v1 [Gossypium barbadense]TYG50940.1 hypothetical protein ES288_D10G215800v1 [Gossypium darwinii]
MTTERTRTAPPGTAHGGADVACTEAAVRRCAWLG